MTDKELLYVKTIIEESSITKAAAKLYIAQPSLSQAVQKIEASLGVHLFERTSRGLQPTRGGMKYYEVASHILRIYHELLEEIGDGRNPQEQLVLGTTTLLSNLLLGDVCPVFWKEYPGVKVHFWEESRNGILQKLNNGESGCVAAELFGGFPGIGGIREVEKAVLDAECALWPEACLHRSDPYFHAFHRGNQLYL
ncbi:MAG TPA: LysR family transcriptional regulator [Candidatus Eisenbergiella intestinipullorum]|nr:LysR family transcriptional regulator [Candidatus Eisenbergiella intestinipullorum]